MVLAIFGVDGPLLWRDLQTGGAAIPAGRSGDDRAEIVVPFEP